MKVKDRKRRHLRVAPFRVNGCAPVRLSNGQDDHNYDDDHGSRPDHDSPVASALSHPIANAAAPNAVVTLLGAGNTGTGRWVRTASVISIQQAYLQFGMPGLASEVAYSLALLVFLV